MSQDELYFEQIPVGEMANLAYLIGSRSTRARRSSSIPPGTSMRSSTAPRPTA